jgi:hypothetical protein
MQVCDEYKKTLNYVFPNITCLLGYLGIRASSK